MVLSEAEVYLFKKLQFVAQKDLFIKERNIKFEHVFEKVVQHHVCNFKPSTQKSFLKISQLTLPHFQDYLIQQITSDQIYIFLEDRKNLGAKPGTLNKYIFVLRTIFNFAEKMEFVSYNPMIKISKYKEPPPRSRVLSDEEEHIISERIPDWLQDILVIALQTGMRSSEISTLKWDQINFEKKIIFLPDTKSNRPRVVPLTEKALEVFIRRKKIFCVYIFENPKTRRPYVIWNNFKKYCNRYNIENFTFHDLRHTSITRMIKAGISISAIMKIVGHCSETMTHRYTHLSDEYLWSLFQEIKKI